MKDYLSFLQINRFTVDCIPKISNLKIFSPENILLSHTCSQKHLLKYLLAYYFLTSTLCNPSRSLRNANTPTLPAIYTCGSTFVFLTQHDQLHYDLPCSTTWLLVLQDPSKYTCLQSSNKNLLFCHKLLS